MYLKYICISITCISITPTLLIIIRYCCGKQCELLLNRSLIKGLHHILKLLRHLPLSSIIDDKIRPPPLFQPRVEKKFDPLPLLSTRLPTKNVDPHLHFDNSITGYILYFITPQSSSDCSVDLADIIIIYRGHPFMTSTRRVEGIRLR